MRGRREGGVEGVERQLASWLEYSPNKLGVGEMRKSSNHLLSYLYG
jgi:hypothetical protein